MVEAPEALINEYQIVHLIYYRSRNQHRISTWWKYFSILHRKLRWVVQHPDDGTTITFLRKRLLPKCYWEFNLILALGQFINLGITLIGVVAKVDALLAELDVGIIDDSRPKMVSALLFPSPPHAGSAGSVGSAESTVDMSAIDAVTATTTRTKKSKKDKKKKKAKRAIDDIFGF